MFSQWVKSESWVKIYFPLKNMIPTCQHYQVLIGYFKISVEFNRQEARKFNERAKSLWEIQDSSLGWEQEISSLGKAAMESEESIRHSAHIFLQGERESLPLMEKRKGPNIIMASHTWESFFNFSKCSFPEL